MLTLRRVATAGLMSALGACGFFVPPAEPLPPMAAERVVDVGAVTIAPLTEAFTRVADLENPCGRFPSTLSFGVDADKLRVECLPDGRNAMSDGLNGMAGYEHPPSGAPWRVAIDLATGAQVARLDGFTTCSEELDRLELSLQGGRAMFLCSLARGEGAGNWRVVSDPRFEPSVRLTIPNSYQYRFVPIGGAIVRQSGSGTAAEGIPNPEVAFPFRDGDVAWQPLALPPDGSVDCATSTNASIDGRRILLVAGRRVRQEESNGYSFLRCDQVGGLAVDPANGRATFLPDGMFGRLNANDEVLVDRDRGGPWRVQDVLYYVTNSNGHVSVGFASGAALNPGRYSRLQAIAGDRLIAIEATPNTHVGERRFLYVVFDWAGRALAKFEAQRVAIAPERARLVVIAGDRLQVWDLRQ